MRKALRFVLAGRMPATCFDCPFYTEISATGYHGHCSLVPADQVYPLETACCWSDWAKAVRADLRELFRSCRHWLSDLEAMIAQAAADQAKDYTGKRELPQSHRVSEAVKPKSSAKPKPNPRAKGAASG